MVKKPVFCVPENVGLLMSYVWLTYLGFKIFKSHNGELFVGEYMKSTTVIDWHGAILNFTSRESVR
jgi:hypothetical protein